MVCVFEIERDPSDPGLVRRRLSPGCRPEIKDFRNRSSRAVSTPFRRTGNKSTLLSENSLSLVRTLADEVSQPGATVEIYCDKHGGRNHYQPLLIHTFDDVWFNIIEQGRERSIYSAEWKERFVNIRFSVGGDSWFPSSAASIIAKWLRELCMFSLNRYWQERSSVTLRPTAGYYVDAVRFSQEIAPLISQEGFARHQWWRTV
jgi:ribonuclease HII